MKRYFVLLFIALFVVGNSVGQKNDSTGKVTKQIQALTDSIKMLNEKYQTIEAKINTQEISTSLKTAEGIITKQNNFINGFEVLYAVISILIVLVSFLTYFFNIRPLIGRADFAVRQSENAITNLNSRIDNFNQTIENSINSKFSDFETKISNDRITQIFLDLLSDLPFQKKLALELISTIPQEEIKSIRIYQLFEFLNRKTTKEEEKTVVVEILIQKNTDEVRFLLKNWLEVKAHNYSLKSILLKYYTENGLANFLNPITSFIINNITPHLEFKTLAGYLSSYGIIGILDIVNHSPLARALDEYNKKEICEFLHSNKIIWNLEEEINACLICKSIS